MGAVPTRQCQRPGSDFGDDLSFCFEDYTRLPKFRDRGDGAEEPSNMTSSNMKLHGSGLAVSDSDESSGGAEDIDDYLEAALNEMDKEEVGSGESPLRNRNARAEHQMTRTGSGDRRHSMGETPTDSRPPQRVSQKARPSSEAAPSFVAANESKPRRPAPPPPSKPRPDKKQVPLPDKKPVPALEDRDTERRVKTPERTPNVREAKQAAFTFANQSRGMQAAAHGDKNLLQRLVEDPDIDFGALTRDSHGSTPIHKAAEGGHIDCLKWLISQVPAEALHMQDADFVTPALIAITNGHIDCLMLLVQAANGEVETFDKGLTLLHHAAYYGQDDCLSFLLSKVKEKQGNINASLADDAGVTPAHIAAQQDHLHCLQVLVEANVDVTAEDEDGQTPVDWANQSDKKGCSHYLLLVDSCHTLSATVSKLQGHLGRVKEENRLLKKELSQVRRSQAAVEQKIRKECEEIIDEVRKEYVDMTVRLMQKIDRNQNAATPSHVDQRVMFAERRADEAAAENRQLHRKLEEAYRQLDSRERSHSPPSHGSPLPTGIEATPLLKDYLSRTAHQVLQQQGQLPISDRVPPTSLRQRSSHSQLSNGDAAGLLRAKPSPPPRIDSWQKSYEIHHLTDSEEKSDPSLRGSSNTLQSSGSSVEI